MFIGVACLLCGNQTGFNHFELLQEFESTQLFCICSNLQWLVITGLLVFLVSHSCHSEFDMFGLVQEVRHCLGNEFVTLPNLYNDTNLLQNSIQFFIAEVQEVC